MAPREIATGIPHRLVVLLVLAHVAFAGGRFTLTLAAVARHASAFEIGALLGLIMVLPMLLAVRTGRWCDRVGYVLPAAIGLAMLAASCAVAAASTSMASLYPASVLVGSGFMLTMIAVNNVIGQASDPARLTHAFSLLTMGFSLSGVVGPLICGFVIDHFGYAPAFLVLLLFCTASMLTLAAAGKVHVVPRRESPAVSASVRDLVTREPLRSIFIVSAVISIGWDLFMFLAPLHGVRSGLSATATSLVIGVFGVGTFAIRVVLPRITSGVSQWRALSVSLFVTALCYLAFPLATTLQFLIPAAFAMGLALGCGQPMAMSLIFLSAPPERSGEAAGVRSTITSFTQTVLPLVFGAIGTALGVFAVFWIGAVLMAAGGAFASRRK